MLATHHKSTSDAYDFATSRNQIFPITLQLSAFQSIIDTHHCFKTVIVTRLAAGSCYIMLSQRSTHSTRSHMCLVNILRTLFQYHWLLLWFYVFSATHLKRYSGKGSIGFTGCQRVHVPKWVNSRS